MVSVPVLLLSGILLPMELAPRWLRTLAAINPFSHVVDGARAAFRGRPRRQLARDRPRRRRDRSPSRRLAIANRTFQRESA